MQIDASVWLHLFHVLTKEPGPIGYGFEIADRIWWCVFTDREHDLQGWCVVVVANKKAC